ncbi:MAG: c-type cytochrome [Bacteroidetes bacterium]|nr:c-type cytochrome [Bacteroidota bacterium]
MKKYVLVIATMVFVFVLASFSSDMGDPWEIPAKYKLMKNPTIPDEENLAIGKTLYNKHCKSCHGTSGFGDGNKAGELETEMLDISTKEYKGRKPGVKYFQSFIGRGEMPNYERKIPVEEDRWFVVNYMDTF